MTTFTRSLLRVAFAFAFTLQAYAASDDSAWKKDPKDWNVELYPVFAWLPVMGASAVLPEFPELPNLPSLPDRPGDPRPSSKATSGLSGAAFFKARIDKSKWSVDMEVLWAGLTAETTSPKVTIKSKIIYGQAMGGREILPDLWLEGGVRRMALNVGVTALSFPEVARKPSITDPLIGLSYRHPLGKKFRVDLHADGGGFGVGSDVDVAATARVDWRISRHFGLGLGWGLLHLKITNTVLQRTLTLNQTLNGPILGIGIYF
jgi:hypothetical protein